MLVGASCQKKEKPVPVSLQEIIGQDAFVRDQVDLDIKGQEKTLVLYVLDKEVKKDEDIWCGNKSGEKLFGRFYLALIAENKIESKIELLMDYFENGGEFRSKNIIIPQDLNGDSEELEFAFETYASCNGVYLEVIGVREKELLRYNFYKGEEILDELFVSAMTGPGLEYENGYLVQEYYSNEYPGGTFKNYYSFSQEKQGFDFVKSVEVLD